jgi:hypothetical protein
LRVRFLSARYTTPNPLRDLANALVQRHPDLFFQLDGYRRPAKPRSLSPCPRKAGANALGDEGGGGSPVSWDARASARSASRLGHGSVS